ncbi:MAG: DUF1289 domain-containing protein [Methylococcaceae bacterium]|nr:DUF1289 domain-containing protein [Methylococcaceae bacterium]
MNLSMDPLASPCIRHCCLDQNNVCAGCFRTLEEITGWAQSDTAARAAILVHTEKRRLQYSRVDQ